MDPAQWTQWAQVFQHRLCLPLPSVPTSVSRWSHVGCVDHCLILLSFRLLMNQEPWWKHGGSSSSRRPRCLCRRKQCDLMWCIEKQQLTVPTSIGLWLEEVSPRHKTALSNWWRQQQKVYWKNALVCSWVHCCLRKAAVFSPTSVHYVQWASDSIALSQWSLLPQKWQFLLSSRLWTQWIAPLEKIAA